MQIANNDRKIEIVNILGQRIIRDALASNSDPIVAKVNLRFRRSKSKVDRALGAVCYCIPHMSVGPMENPTAPPTRERVGAVDGQWALR